MAKAGLISEIVDVGAVNKQLADLKSQLDGIVAQIDAINKAGIAIKGANNIQALGQAQANANTKAQAAIDLTAKLTEEELKLARAKVEKQTRTKQATDAVKEEINANAAIVGEYKALDNELKKVRDAYKNLAAAGKENTKEAKDLAARTQELDTKIKAIDATVGQHQRNVGNYKSALSKLGEQASALPGPIGGIGSAISKVSKIMLANPILLVITAIVGAVMALVNAFKSTDEGATELDARFKQISVIIDVVVQRVAQFASGLLSIMKGNFAAGMDKLKTSFTGVADQMRLAAKAAYEFVYAMDEINDRNTAFISDEARLKQEISDLKYIYNDQTKSLGERQAALEGIMKKEKELSDFKAQIAKDTFKAELDRIAGERGVAVEQLMEIVMIPAAELKERLKDETSGFTQLFQAMNDEEKALLEKLYANILNAQTEFTDNTRRQQKQLTDLYQDAKDKRVKALNEQTEALRKSIEEQQKAYESAIKGNADADKKAAEESFKYRLKFQLMSQEEFIKNETDLLLKSADYINSSAEQKAQALKMTYDKALKDARQAGLLMAIELQASADDIAEPEWQMPMMDAAVQQGQQLQQQQDRLNSIQQDAAAWEMRLQIANDYTSRIDDLVTKAFAIRMQQIDIESQADQAAKQKELEAAAGNAAKIDEINARYLVREKERDKERKRLQLEQAKYQKAQGIVSSIINTGMGVTNALTVQPATLIPFMVALALATGLAQTAMIAAQPLPQYAKGRKGGRGEWAQINEQGQEAVVTSTGAVYLPQSPIVYLPEGASVIPHNELVDLAARSATVYGLPMSTTTDTSAAIRSEISGLHRGFAMLANEIRGKKETSINITERGIWANVKHGANYQKWVDNIRL